MPTEEQVDMSDYCTNEQHAIDRAKWLCQQRKYQTHAVKFKTVPTEAPIQAGSIIKVGLETLKYDSPAGQSPVMAPCRPTQCRPASSSICLGRQRR